MGQRGRSWQLARARARFLSGHAIDVDFVGRSPLEARRRQRTCPNDALRYQYHVSTFYPDLQTRNRQEGRTVSTRVRSCWWPLILNSTSDTSNLFPSTIDGSAQPCADQTQAENGQMCRGGHSELTSASVTAYKVATHSSVKLSDT